MSFMFTGVFWSVVLILLGIGVILNAVLRTRIPFFRIFFALLLVYIGVALMVGSPWHVRRWSSYRWHEGTRVERAPGEHDVAFGNSEIDLSGLELKDSIIQEKVDVAFGSARVVLPANMPVRVEVSTAFGDASLPDESHTGFGDHTYRSPNLDETKPYLMVKADIAFGQLVVVRAKPAAPKEQT